MGGKAWNLPRMPREQYLEVEKAMRAHLDTKIPGEYRIPRYFADKKNFGDLDILVSSEVLQKDPEFLQTLCIDLGITQHRSGGAFYTTVFKGLQTDFFPCPASEIDSQYTFMCFGEIGNILGRLVRRFKLKFGIDGLTYVFRHGDHYKYVVPLTQDFSFICEMLGLDYATWVRGFEAQEEMFKWITVSPWFSPKPYLDEDGPIAQRASIRPGMAAFVEFVKAHVPEDAGGYLEDPLTWVSDKFPQVGLKDKIAEQMRKVENKTANAAKFNGKIVMAAHPHLKGDALGRFISAFKTSHPHFDDYVAVTSEEQIKEDIRCFQP